MEAEWQAKQAAVFAAGQQQQQHGTSSTGVPRAPRNSAGVATALSELSLASTTSTRPDSTQRRRLEPIDLTSLASSTTTTTTATAADRGAASPLSPTTSSTLVANIRGRRAEMDTARLERSKRRVRALAREQSLQEATEAEERSALLLAKLARSSAEENRIAIELTMRRDEERIMRDNVLFRYHRACLITRFLTQASVSADSLIRTV